MVVNDLDDLHFVRALHGLREFVVIHQNKLPGHRFDEVGFGNNANQAAFIV